jgi:hypothetical protein
MEVETEETKWPKTLFDDTEPRAEGTHLSDVTRSILDSANYWKGKGGFNDMELTAEIGLLWEEALSKIMRDKYALRPPQMEEDGVWMSPDGIGPDPAGLVPLVVEEYKATWKSTKSCPTEQMHYMMQVKSYCRALDTTVAVMRIFYIMGDYKGSGPIYRVSRIVFTQKELDRNWDMILRHRKEEGL